MAVRESTTKGFKKGGSLLGARIRRVSETRGFAVSRVLTHWREIVGEDLARATRPVKIGYGRHGLGATLTILTTGAMAPMVQMQLETLRAKVNAAYGYNAISKVAVTQTAPTGFAEGQAMFDPKPNATLPKDTVSDADKAKAATLTRPLEDKALRQALERLGQNVLSKTSETNRS